jgi:hypothetical protein
MAESPSKEEFSQVPDGGILKTLPAGLVIIRRRKHEPLDLSVLQAAQIVERTGKRSGSKFLKDWDLVTYVVWIEAQIRALNWTSETGPATATIEFDAATGISRGRYVS